MEKPNKISLVIFDMDGLMFDTERLSIPAWQYAGEHFGYKITLDAINRIVGVNLRSAEKIFKDYFGEDFPFYEARKLKMRCTDEYLEKNGMPVKAGLYELLDFLERESVLRSVATSTERERAKRYLSLAGIENRFNLIVCGDEVERSKPEPDIFLAAAKKLDCAPDECIVLEDSENGIIAASKAGMYPILVPDMRKPPEDVQKLVFKEFKSLFDVKAFLETELYR